MLVPSCRRPPENRALGQSPEDPLARGRRTYRVGVDENGLGARLGPMITTAVGAWADSEGLALLDRPLMPEVAADLGDSKTLVSHANARLAEAWARLLAADGEVSTPLACLQRLLLEPEDDLQQLCPQHAARQCWSVGTEQFVADTALVDRLRAHRRWFREHGVDLASAVVSVACVRRLNLARQEGLSRFTVDLHAMERLVLAHRELAGQEVVAICGQVGGIRDYARYFGPLGGRLHTSLGAAAGRRGYRFPGVGELHFVVDADGSDPLVMLASLVGKYVRELLMARVARFYVEAGMDGGPLPSGYHDPVTSRFVAATENARRRRRIPIVCFERARDRS